MSPWRPGRDRRAVPVLPPLPAGTGPDRPRAVVVGGGIAGLAAATGLAEQGVAVTVLEARETLGGRVRAWPLADGRTMSRGFHAFFRQYYNLRSLLRRADPGLTRLVPLPDYPLSLAGGPTDSFARIPRTPPWSIIGFVLASPTFRLEDLVRVDARAALDLLRVEFPRTFHETTGVSAADVLDRLRFPRQARHLALEVFARSFFADPREFSGGELLAMFHTYFLGSAEGLLFDVPDDDYDTALWLPLAGYLDRLGVEIRTGVTVGELEQRDGGVVAVHEGGEVAADAAVLALDTAGLQGLVERSAWLGDAGWRERIGRLRVAPPFGVGRRWLAEPQPDLPPFLGTSGYGPLDNVSRLDAFEAGAARWAADRRGAVIEVHGYALTDPSPGTPEELWREAERVAPSLAGAAVVAEEWLLEQDCPLVDTTPWAQRPPVVTPDPRVVLAGDLVRCELPVALMERAATTGWQAANQLLAGWGRRGTTLWSPPLRGLLAPDPR